MKVSKNFKKYEFTDSVEGKKAGITNEMSVDDAIRATQLAILVLQPVRDKFGPIKIRSGKRVDALNKLVGGSKTSEHRLASAADIEPICKNEIERRLALQKIYYWIKDNLDYNELILEYSKNSHDVDWVHVSFRIDGNKKEAWVQKR
jgi:hypothetical protein